MAIKGEYNNTDKAIRATRDGDLITRAIIEEEIEHFAGLGNSFSFHVTSTAIDTADTVLFLRNDDSNLFVPDRVTFNSDLSATMTWQIRLGKAITTPSGNALTPVNIYPTFSGKTFTHISLQDETAVAAGDIIEECTMAALASPLHVDLHGVILGKGQYLQFDIVGTTPVVGMTLWGHWESEAV
tara:strand:- start:3852 stop:4403 length:552 start_codon:yes stop_codon:yes gene_type:complete